MTGARSLNVDFGDENSKMDLLQTQQMQGGFYFPRLAMIIGGLPVPF